MKPSLKTCALYEGLKPPALSRYGETDDRKDEVKNKAMPDIKTLETFRSIADLGSFQAAARNMGLSLSAISLQMKRLEEFAQLKLFDRSKNRA